MGDWYVIAQHSDRHRERRAQRDRVLSPRRGRHDRDDIHVPQGRLRRCREALHAARLRARRHRQRGLGHAVRLAGQGRLSDRLRRSRLHARRSSAARRATTSGSWRAARRSPRPITSASSRSSRARATTSRRSAGCRSAWQCGAVSDSRVARRAPALGGQRCGAPMRQPGSDARRIDWPRVLPFVAVHARLPRRVLDRRQRHRARRRGRALRCCACSRSPRSTTATSRIAHSAPRAPRSSPSRCSARAPCSADRCGGPRTTGITTCTRTGRRTATRRSQHGFLWSHAGWFLARENFATRHRARAGPRALPGAALARPLRCRRARSRSRCCCSARARGSRAPRRARDGRLAAPGMGILHLDGRALARDLHDQLARAPLRQRVATRRATTRATTRGSR